MIKKYISVYLRLIIIYVQILKFQVDGDEIPTMFALECVTLKVAKQKQIHL